MVSFELTEEEKMVQQVAHDFAKKEIRPVAAYYDEHEEVPYDIIKKAAAIGFGISKDGGSLLEGSGSALIPSILAEELSWGCAGIALAINSSGLAAASIAATGSPEQREKWLAAIASDANEVHLGAMCLTEPDAGSDVANIQTTATRDGDEYVLNGEKQFITNGNIADVHVVFATEDRSKGWGGLGAYIVPRGTPGLEEGTTWKKMGIRASHTANVVLNECRIPVEYKLGAPSAGGGGSGPGALGALMTLERTRPVVGAYALGIGRAAYEYALDYAKQRVQFGKPIIKNQAVSFMLADMAMAVDSARLMVWRAAWMGGASVPYLQAEGSMAKCFASDMAMKVTVDAVQVLGGQGFMRDHPVEKWVRDAKIFQIFEGTNQIQRMVIGRALDALPPRG